MTTRATGVPTATAALREFLVSHFDLDALEVLCFDLAIDYDILPHRTRIELADGLIEHCSGLGQLRHLAVTALARRPSVPDGSALAVVLDQLPTTPATRVRVQVTLDLDMNEWGDRPMREVVEHIARLGGVARLEIHALAAQPGSVRFLIGVPETVLPRLLAAPLPQLASGRWNIVRIDPFDALPLAMQAAWQAEFHSRAPGRDSQQRKLNYPIKRGCLGRGLGLIALIAIAVGALAVIAQIPQSSPPRPDPSIRATATPTPTPFSASTETPTSTPSSIPTRTDTPTPTRTATSTPSPTPTASDRTRPVITSLQASPLEAGTKPCAVTLVTIAATVVDDGGIAQVEIDYSFRAEPNTVGDPVPTKSIGPYVAGARKPGGLKTLAYKASVNLASHDNTLSAEPYSSWTLAYSIVATDSNNNRTESKANSDVTVFTICGPD